MMRTVKVAICGKLPTTYQFLLQQNIFEIDQFEDATQLLEESKYHLILIYAPGGEGIFDTVYTRKTVSGSSDVVIPIRLLNEPACTSALLELKHTLQHIQAAL